jgi:hypothetical protein
MQKERTRARIGRLWMRIRIRQNDADLTRSVRIRSTSEQRPNDYPYRMQYV